MNRADRKRIAFGAGATVTVVLGLAAAGWWRDFEWGTYNRACYWFALLGWHGHGIREQMAGVPLPRPEWVDGDVATTALLLPAWQRHIIERRAQEWADRQKARTQ